MIDFESVLYPDEEIAELYEQYKKLVIPDKEIPIDELIRQCNGFFFKAIVNGVFQGCIYIHNWKMKDKEWHSAYLSGFSKPKNQLNTIPAINTICRYLFDTYGIQEILSETKHRHAVICLKRAGFKHLKNDIYRKEI